MNKIKGYTKITNKEIEELGFTMIESEKSSYLGPLFEKIVHCPLDSNSQKLYRIHLQQHNRISIYIEETTSYGVFKQNMNFVVFDKDELAVLLRQVIGV